MEPQRFSNFSNGNMMMNHDEPLDGAGKSIDKVPNDGIFQCLTMTYSATCFPLNTQFLQLVIRTSG